MHGVCVQNLGLNDKKGDTMSQVFEGIKVIDFTSNVAGPSCTAMLADMGAEVIKIERPISGDDSRALPPMLEGKSIEFCWLNRGKKSLVLSLKDPKAQAVLLKMIADADVIVESYKPGQMAKFGLDYESVVKVNPQIIYTSISACGQTGAYAWRPGYDVIAQGMSGFMDMQGDPDGDPVKCGTAIGDYIGAFNAYSSTVTALYHKKVTGEGQHIDISLLDGLVSIMTPIEGAATLDAHPTRAGRHHGTMAPYGVFRGLNGQSVLIAAFANLQWNKLCTVIGQPDLPQDDRFSSLVSRSQHVKEIEAILECWLAGFENVDDAIALMEAGGVACCKIRSLNEVVKDPVLWERGTIREIELPAYFTEHRTYKGRGPWVHYTKTPADMKPAAALGQHNHELLEKYGWSTEEVDEAESAWATKK